MDNRIKNGLQCLEDEFGKDRVVQAVQAVKRFEVEIPSWVFGKFGGGRFGGYLPPGCARTIQEKLDDAAFVHKLTGATRSVAMHMLWDFSSDGETGSPETAEKVAFQCRDRNLSIGSVSPTYFLNGSHRGSLSATEQKTRMRFIEQALIAGQIADQFGNGLLTLWLPDGSLYPGQAALGRAFETSKKSLEEICSKLDRRITLLLEYKVFEPGTYSTVIPDWGTAYLLAKHLGENVGVLVDLGHHPHGTNIEQIVARLIREKMKCGFHFNARYAADDDHAVEPNPEMARIFYELVTGRVANNENPDKNWAYMIDQCSGREDRIQAVLHSVDSLQLSLAKAILVDQEVLRRLQDADEIILANRCLNDALILADVRPIVWLARVERNLPPDPVAAYCESGYRVKIEAERV